MLPERKFPEIIFPENKASTSSAYKMKLSPNIMLPKHSIDVYTYPNIHLSQPGHKHKALLFHSLEHKELKNK